MVLLGAMPLCPWCKIQILQSAGPCPRCGRRVVEPSVAGRGDSLLDSFEDEAPTASLELDLGPSLPRAKLPATDPGGGAYGELDDEETGFADDKLMLDLPSPARAARPSSPRADLVARRTATGEAGALPMLAAPSELDRYEVLALADYGPVPTSMLQTVPYALRVKRRQYELRRSMAEVRAALAQAEARRDERWVELGEVLRPLVTTLADPPRFAGSLEAAERMRGTREAGLAQADAAFQERVASLDRQLSALEAPGATGRADLEQRRADVALAEAMRQKHEARRKRVDIDVRAARSMLRSPQSTAQERQLAEARVAAAQQ